MLGIYESTIRKMSFETGINKNEIEKGLKLFEGQGKVKHENNYVILINYMKHQNFNTNMKKSAIDVYNNLPKVLKHKDLIVSKSNPSEGFERLLNHYGMVSKVEVEYEVELESKVEVEKEIKEEVIFPFSSEEFLSQWFLWKDYKKKEFSFKYKSIISEQAALMDLNKKSNQDEPTAIKIIHQSISNGWKGFFKLKNENNESNSKTIDTQSISDKINAIVEAQERNGAE